MPDNSFIRSGAFQFCINVEKGGRSPRDDKLQNTYAHRDLYEVRSAEGKMEGVDNFAALFVNCIIRTALHRTVPVAGRAIKSSRMAIAAMPAGIANREVGRREEVITSPGRRDTCS